MEDDKLYRQALEEMKELAERVLEEWASSQKIMTMKKSGL